MNLDRINFREQDFVLGKQVKIVLFFSVWERYILWDLVSVCKYVWMNLNQKASKCGFAKSAFDVHREESRWNNKVVPRFWKTKEIFGFCIDNIGARA